MKFLHAADLHLDSPMHGLQAYEGAPVEMLRGATRQAYDALISLAIVENVQLVVLAGDIYDGDWPDANTGLYFIQGLHRLKNANIPVVLLSGNHDAANRITRKLTYPDNVHVLPTDSPGTVWFENLHVAVHGQGYPRQEERSNLVRHYPQREGGWFNVGLLHTALEGRDGYDNYAPCTLSELLALNYDYWALGHIHQRESVHGTASPRIEFPGCIQGRSVRECGPKGCLTVSVEDGSIKSVRFHPLDVVRWQIANVDASAAADRETVREATVSAITAARADADGRLLAVRVVVTVGESVHSQLQDLRADLCGAFSEGVWIEKVQLRRAAVTEMEPVLSEDAEAELLNALRELNGDGAVLDQVLSAGDCGRLKAYVPRELLPDWVFWHDEIRSRAKALLLSSAEGES